MRKTTFSVIAVISSISLWGQTKSFKGAWFEVKYPSSFTVKPSLKSATSDKGYESSFFESPDHLVEFYIYSPQWSGNPNDIVLKTTEKTTNTKTQKSENRTITWWTISAKDGSYTRSYQEIKDDLSSTNWVIGIKYKNQTAFNQYKKQYLDFKSSIVQFAD